MKSLNKKIVLLLFFLNALYGEYANNYSEGLTGAIKEHKRLFIVIYDEKNYESNSYYDMLKQNNSLIDKINTSYKIVFLEKNRDEYPKRYQTKFPTTTFLITPPSEIEDEMIIGYVNPSKLLRIALADEI